ncbi:hypothetical protein AB0G74_18435 [Streptomyces sp. NPDC020875]|uniref:TolB family protein n=1 Tax=Streptomyces sp. NPDC020875 TaxID=3154898 RepID=UPI0033C576CE
MRVNANLSTTGRMRAALSTAVVVWALAAVTPTAATASTTTASTVTRISVATDDGYGAASITPDGRSVVFTSLRNAPPQSGNEVYVHDRLTGQTRTEPLTEGWTPAISGDGRQVAANAPAQGMSSQRIRQHSLNLGLLPVICGRCNQPSLSTDGRYLAFGALRTGLLRNVVISDRDGGFQTIASLNSSAPARPSISGDGRYVAYQDLSYQTEGVYLHDRTTGTTSGPLEGPATSASLVQLSDNGTKVVYVSGPDTYVHDIASGTAQLVPNVRGLAIDPTGRYLLHAPNTTGGPSLVLRDLPKATDRTVSTEPATAEVDSVGAGGRDVVFQSSADNIVPGDTNGKPDVFVRTFS